LRETRSSDNELLARPPIRTGALRALDVGFEPEGAELFIAYPRDRTASAKIQALTRHLRQTFGDPYWEKPRE
jgi:DNA-binding transcriptional LysR family regulator